MDRGAWQATVHEVAKSRTRLSDLANMHPTLQSAGYRKMQEDAQESSAESLTQASGGTMAEGREEAEKGRGHQRGSLNGRGGHAPAPLRPQIWE